MADTDGPDEAELAEMIKRLRPHPIITSLKVLAVIAGIVTVFALIIAQTLLAGRSIATAPPDAAVPENGPDDEFAVMTTLAPEIRFDPPLRAVAEQTVTVRASTAGGDGQTFGSGFLIADGVVVSAAHVVPGAHEGVTYPVHIFCGDREVMAGVTVYDALRDVMVIEAPECRADTLVFDDRRLGVDDTLHVAGFMFLTDAGLAYRFHRFTSAIPTAVLRPTELRADPDILARVREMRRQGVARYRALSGAAIPGNSGSPVFDDRGRIVGMLVIRDERHDRSYMVPASTILWVLRANGVIPCPL